MFGREGVFNLRNLHTQRKPPKMVPAFLLLWDLGSSLGCRYVKIEWFQFWYRTTRALIKTRIFERRNQTDDDMSYRG